MWESHHRPPRRNSNSIWWSTWLHEDFWHQLTCMIEWKVGYPHVWWDRRTDCNWVFVWGWKEHRLPALHLQSGPTTEAGKCCRMMWEAMERQNNPALLNARTSHTGKVGAFTVWVYDHHTIYTCRHKHIYTNRSNAPNANTNSPTMALFSGMLFRLHSTCLTLPQPAKQEWWSHERSALGHHLPALLQMKWCDFVARAFAPPSQSTNKRT